MNNLKLDAEITSEFQGVINGNSIGYEEVYSTITILICNLSTCLDEPNITKPNEFIKDLITAFEDLYINYQYYTTSSYGNTDFYMANTGEEFYYIRDLFIEKTQHTVFKQPHITFNELSKITYDLIEIENHKEFKLLHERLISGYYTS